MGWNPEKRATRLEAWRGRLSFTEDLWIKAKDEGEGEDHEFRVEEDEDAGLGRGSICG